MHISFLYRSDRRGRIIRNEAAAAQIKEQVKKAAMEQADDEVEAAKHALRLFDAAEAHDRSVNALLVLSSCHLELTQPGEVVQTCLDHLRHWEMAPLCEQPQDHALLSLLYAQVGRAFFLLQRYDVAVDTLHSALRVCPHDSGYRGTVLQNLGAALNAAGGCLRVCVSACSCVCNWASDHCC